MMFNVELVALLVGFIWLLVLTILWWKLRSHYEGLTAGVDTKTIPAILEKLTKESQMTKTDLADLMTRCAKIEKEGKLHIQKIGLLRFNPFKDTGGDQSFIVSLLNADDTGIVISGLYSRSGTRWYAKKVLAGRGADYELSEEENKALQIAKSVQ